MLQWFCKSDRVDLPQPNCPWQTVNLAFIELDLYIVTFITFIYFLKTVQSFHIELITFLPHLHPFVLNWLQNKFILEVHICNGLTMIKEMCSFSLLNHFF